MAADRAHRAFLENETGADIDTFRRAPGAVCLTTPGRAESRGRRRCTVGERTSATKGYDCITMPEGGIPDTVTESRDARMFL